MNNKKTINIALYNNAPHEKTPTPSAPYLNVSIIDVIGFNWNIHCLSTGMEFNG